VNSPVHVLLLPLAGDSDPDLIVAQYNKPAAQGLKVFAGGPGATFGAPSTCSSGAGPPASLDWGDFNQDGRIDLAVGHPFAAYPNHIAPVDVLAGGAAASLLAAAPVAGSAGTSLAVGDLDRDGRDDLYVAAGEPPFFGARSLPVFLHGNGDGSFGAPLSATAATFPLAIESEYGPVIDDLDGDGWPDVLTRGLYDGGYSLRYGVGPQLAPTPDALDFGSQLVGTVSASQTVTFTNTGPGTATSIAVLRDSDADHQDFPVSSDGCSGKTLPLGASCNVVVAFAPLAVGDRESLIAAGGQESDTIVVADLFGIGTAPEVMPAPSAPPAPAGARTPTPQPAKASLPVRAPRILSVNRRTLQTRGLRFTQRFDRAGIARWTLDAVISKTRAAKAPRTTPLGRAAKTLRAAGSVTVTLRLTRTGRRFIANHAKAKLRLRTAFVDRAGQRFLLTTPVTLRR
jgi:FG-GAP-like repeat/FG-GAP repeat